MSREDTKSEDAKKALQSLKGRGFVSRFIYAYRGLAFAWSNEFSFRTELIALLSAILLLIYLRPMPVWWAAVAIVSGGVLTAELINTALERALDRLYPEVDPLIGQAKDCAAAAVFIMCAASLAVLGALLVETLGTK